MAYRHECTFQLPDGSSVTGTRWKNPDGSVGGWVAKTAKVDPSATIEFNAMVGPDVVVEQGEIVQSDRVMA